MTRWWLVIHVLGAVIFLGNIVVTFFWKLMADRTRDPKVLAFSQQLVARTDKVFTALGATLLAASGYAYAGHMKISVMHTSWLLWSQIFFYASAVIWAAILVPIQIKQSRMAKEFAVSGEISDEYWRLTRRWNLAGAVATVLPAIALALMVLK
jgi:uncharacterized membrane protein